MDTSAALSVGLTRADRGWAVALLSRLQTSSIMLTSFYPGGVLPFIRQDLALAAASRTATRGIGDDDRPHGAPIRCLVLTFSPSTAGVCVTAAERPSFSSRTGGAFSRAPGSASCLVLCHEMATPARPLLLQQWVAPRQCPGACRRAIAAQYPDGHGDQHECLAHCNCGQLAPGLLYPGQFLVVQTLAWCSSPMRARRLLAEPSAAGLAGITRGSTRPCGLTHRAGSWGSPCSLWPPPGQPL